MNNNLFSNESMKIIVKISELECIPEETLLEILTDYHRRLKEGILCYKKKDGLSDYILKSHDLIILYSLCKNTKPFDDKIELLLIFMYAYYKLDDFLFTTKDFKLNNLFKFIKKNNSIHSLIYELVTNKELLREAKIKI